MTNYTVIFQPSGKSAEIEEGRTVLDAARRAGVHLNQVCGGEGTCGKCRVTVLDGRVEAPSSPLLSREEEAGGMVLACLASVLSDLTVDVPPESRGAQGEESAEEASLRFRDRTEADLEKAGFGHDPLVRKIRLCLSPPDLKDNRDDLSRLYKAVRKETGSDNPVIEPGILPDLPRILREEDWQLTVTLADIDGRDEIIRLESGERDAPDYGIAVDIGTTTVVAHLVELGTDRTLEAGARYNSQIAFGEDVIKRIMGAEDGQQEELAEAVRGDINMLIDDLCARTKIDGNRISALVCSGNSTMISLFLNISPAFIRREPYVPPASAPPAFQAKDLDLKIYPFAPVYTVPGIAGWVGGDITAGILASKMASSEKLSLLVDIGTNGEIVIGNQDWQLTCSCSAGPAFEGSGISCGMRAGRGAVERISNLGEDSIDYTVIGSCAPTGICGSGLLELVYRLFCAGILGRDGKFDPEYPSPRIREIDGAPAFVLVEEGESAAGRPIVITQADVDNLIRAKAAVYAGIKVLLNSVGIEAERLERIFVSGGFGNYLNITEAIGIGMLPDIAPEKIHFIGNGSIRGAKFILLSRAAEAEARTIAAAATYFELSTENDFMEEYTRAMFLPHTDIEDFPGTCR